MIVRVLIKFYVRVYAEFMGFSDYKNQNIKIHIIKYRKQLNFS